MDKIKKMLPYLLICALAFYIPPLIIKYIGEWIIFLVVIVMPAICFVVSVIYGATNKFAPLHLLYPLIVGVLDIPAIYIFYNSTAWIYPLAYAVISLIGSMVGYGVARLRKRSSDTEL